MSSQEEFVSEYKTSAKEELRKRQQSIDEGEALDKEIHLRMAAGEIGVSHGTDNHIGVIMLSLAAVFTLFCLYVVFGISPAHYTG
ncbi:MAG: hypothetical protein HN351_04675 [Deltaproteobacteria bacterium]|nr:hypothetical protein [Deltaproteobacteria bacterium]